MNREHSDETASRTGGGMPADASDRELLEARITAHALGQLDAADAAEIERLLAHPSAAEMRRQVAEMRRQVAEMRRLAEAIKSAPDEPGLARSSDLRRAVLAAAAGGSTAVATGGPDPGGPDPGGPDPGAPDPGAPDTWTARGRRPWPRFVAVGSLAAALLVAATLLIGRQAERPDERLAAMRSRPREEAVAPAAKSVAAQTPTSTEAAQEADAATPAPAREAGEAEAAKLARRATPQDDALRKRVTSSDKAAAEPAAEAPAAAADEAVLAIVKEFAHAAKRQSTSDAMKSKQAADIAAGDQTFRQLSRGAAVAPGLPEPRAASLAASVGPGAGAANGVADRETQTDRLIIGAGVNAAEAETEGLVRSSAGEGYAAVVESRPVSPREQPLSTFSIDVDTASYANARRFLASGRRPPRDAVRIEEIVNYFRYDYPQPKGDTPFSVTVDAAECPWKPGHRLVRIGLQGKDIDRGARPAGNLVFLVDVSGSMQAPNKLALVKQALAMLVEELTENDRVSIVTYAGNAGLVLPPTTGDRKREILTAIESLTPGGSTHGSAGITLAYEQAREHFIPGGSNRVILASDGDLNVGVTSLTDLIALIKEKAAGGTFLTVLGFGEGNLQDAKMEALADNGNGVYAYIDGVREARKVLVEQLTGSTVTIAKDVKIQVEFNPSQVESYRLLGYENRALAARDFRDDKKDAGEIGAGHSVTALYEVVLVGDDQAAVGGAEPLKYQPQPEVQEPVAVDPNANKELLTVKLRWKRPDGDTSTLVEVPLADRGGAFGAAPADLRFAAAVAAFGMILRESSERGDASLPLVAEIAGKALGRDEGGYRAEFLDLVRHAESSR
jgi:secreted protein with Ig-like and vWFA domain